MSGTTRTPGRFDPSRAPRPTANPSLDEAQPLLERAKDSGTVGADVAENFVEIAQRLVGVDDPHPRRYFEKTASTSLSLANRPWRAASTLRFAIRQLASLCHSPSADQY